MKSKRLLGLLISLVTISITITTSSSDISNTTSYVYSMPFTPAMQAYMTAASASKARAARRGGSSLSNSCLTNEGASGTCMSRFNCMRLGGTVKGSCTSFSGICCETNLQCGQNSKLKRTIIRNPAQLAIDDCMYVIEPYSSNVCQLLIEFENFELQQPLLIDNKLECMDYLEIGDYILCGNNAQQHLYLPFSVAAGITNVPLNFHIPSRWSQSNWRLIITQLECPAVKKRFPNLSFLPFVTDNSLQDARTVFSTHNSDWDILAPPGCNQYFRQPTGKIKSFNYNDNIGTYYMGNLNYVICIKPTPGATMIEYTVQKFSLNIQSVADPIGFDTDCHSVVTTEGRSEDYLMIPQSTYTYMTVSTRPTYYCGTSLLERSVVTATLPFIMYFASDAVTETMETGFNIDYRVKSVLG